LDNDIKLLKASWPAHADLLKTTERNKGVGLPALKKYYLSHNTDRIMDRRGEDGFYPALRLLLRRNISDSVLDELRDFNKNLTNDRNMISARKQIIDFVLSVSSLPLYTFANNSFFCKAENSILDAIGYDSQSALDTEKERASEWYAGELNRRISGVLEPKYGGFYFKTEPAKYNVTWRYINLWQAKMEGIPESNSITKKMFGQFYHTLLSAEWTSRNSQFFDKRCVHVAQTITSIVSDRNVASNIREFGQKMINDEYDHYVSENGLGQEKVIAVQYDNEFQLAAMVDLFKSSTRYPYPADDHADIVRFVPHMKDSHTRTSFKIIERLWRRGISIDRYKVVDKHTLICYPSPSSNRFDASFDLLRYDATNIAEKIEAKKAFGDDGGHLNKKGFPYALVTGSDLESWCVRCDFKHIQVSTRPRLRELAKGCKSTEDLALLLLTNEAQKLVKKELANALERANRRGEQLELIVKK